MAGDEALFSSTIDLALGGLLVACVVLLLAARPRGPRLWMLGALLAGGAIEAVSDVLLPASFGRAGALVRIVFSVAFLLDFPTRLRFRSAPGALWLGAAAIVVGSAGAIASPLAPRVFADAPDALGYLFDPGGIGVALALALAALSAAWRLRELDAPRRPGAALLPVAVAGYVLAYAGERWCFTLGTLLSGGTPRLPTPPGDPLHLVPLVALLGEFVVPATLVVTLARRGRSRVGLGVLAVGALLGAARFLADPAFVTHAIVDVGEMTAGLVAAQAVLVRRQLGVERAPTWAPVAVAIFGGLAVFIAAALLVQIVAPAGIASTVGAGAGLAAGLAAGLLVLPRARNLGAMQPAGPPQPGQRVGRYRIVRLLGEGSQGLVYEAQDARGGLVALKTFAPHVAQQGLREARLASKLAHPGVVRILETGEDRGLTFVAMELAPGGTLRSRLARGALEPADAERLARELLAALEAAHAAGIVHGDVKPENILLAADGRAMLTDFGVARESRPDATIVDAGAGTPLYMAPEQLLGEPADARSDVYAAAAVFVEALTRTHYLRAKGLDAPLARRRVLSGEIDLDDERLAPHRAWLRKALARDPHERWPTARAAREGLG